MTPGRDPGAERGQTGAEGRGGRASGDARRVQHGGRGPDVPARGTHKPRANVSGKATSATYLLESK